VRLLCPDSTILLRHDEKWLGEAVSNIVKNSIEHTGAGGSIEIEIAETPLMTTVTVSDNGEGISGEDLPHIFKRFYRGRNNPHGSGTGIGLALAKAIIENEGGVISVRSVLGKGSAFTITFPNSVRM
jgi:signal transduction histidine kinase